MNCSASTILRVGWWVGFLWVLLIGALAVVGFLLGRTPARLMLASLLLGSVAHLEPVVRAEQRAGLLLQPDGPRAAGQSAADPLGDRGIDDARPPPFRSRWPCLVERFPRCWPAAITVLTLLLLVMVVNLTNHSAVAGSAWSEQVDAAEATCAADPNATVIVTTQPSTWQVGLPCFVVDG